MERSLDTRVARGPSVLANQIPPTHQPHHTLSVNATRRPSLALTLELPRLLAMLLLLTIFGGCQKPVDEQAEVPPAAVMVVPARMGSVSSTIESIGTVMPVDESLIASSFPGLVVEMPVRDGQYVRQGELLAQLRRVALSIRLAEVRAQLRQREQELQQLETGYRPEEVLQSLARVKAAEALSKYSTARAERATQLHEQDAISDEERDESVYQAESARQAVAEAEADHQLKSAGYRSEEIEAARAARDAQQHIVGRLEDELARRRIEAPFDGYVTQRHTDVGQWVEEGGPVVTLVRLDEVEVRVQVEEDAVEEIRVGQHVDVYVEAIGDEAIDGEIRQIVPKAAWQQGSRSFPIVVRMANTITDGQPRLKEGMSARITFRGPPREVLLVDKDSIDRSSGHAMVFVVEADNRVRAVEIRDGMSQGQLIEVVGDVRAGDQLVTEGVERLRPFERVIVLDGDPVENVAAVSTPTGQDAKRDTADDGTVAASEQAVASDEAHDEKPVTTSGG
jgi:multidrug efflux pump subunit AcrA (membrane-fusion protein)